jgi:hypothetical protein
MRKEDEEERKAREDMEQGRADGGEMRQLWRPIAVGPHAGFSPMHVVTLQRPKKQKRRGCGEMCRDAIVGALSAIASLFKRPVRAADVGFKV